jgi:hypothetical protein
MKLIVILLIFYSTIFAQKITEIEASEFRKIKTDFTKEYIENYVDEFGGNPWCKPFQGCSWYCGGILDTIKSSTNCNYLNNEKIITYKIHDLDYGTSWINSDQDKSKFIEYIFNEKSANFTEIVIVNGNVKNDSLWNEYSRAKKLKMYINGRAFKTLKLIDTKDEQIFKFEPIGGKIKPKSKNKAKQLIIKFEIIDSYQGKKENIAISEIYFDGDGHDVEE